MANTLTQNDCYALMNAIAEQATGRSDLLAVDTTTFVSVGETLLRTGTENTLNAISAVIGKTIFSVRPYKAKLSSLLVAAERWGGITRKVVNLYDEAEASEDYGMNDGDSVDMFKVRKPNVMQLNFVGSQILQKHITRFRDQLSIAFHSEAEFSAFFDAVMTEFFNEVELLDEEKARLTLVNYIAGVKAMNLGNVVDLVALYNTKYGTTYTREQLLSDELVSFMQFVASTIKTYSNRLTDMSVLYHASITGKQPIMRHTPKAKQKMVMYEPLFVDSEATVYSQIFNPQYLDIGSFEGVNFWQSQKEPTKIACKPNILNVTNGESKNYTANVVIPYVLGVLFDEEALGVMPQFEYTSTTPFNSAGGYYNMYMHWKFRSFVDYTENGIVFVLGDGGPATE